MCGGSGVDLWGSVALKRYLVRSGEASSPGLQALHRERSDDDTWPLAQYAQSSVPSWLEASSPSSARCVPGWHATHWVAVSFGATVPTGHISHKGASGTAVYVPRGHGEHRLALLASTKKPGEHMVVGPDVGTEVVGLVVGMELVGFGVGRREGLGVGTAVGLSVRQ